MINYTFFVKVIFLYIHLCVVKYKTHTTLHHHIFFLFSNSMICAEITLIYSLEISSGFQVIQSSGEFASNVAIHLFLLSKYPMQFVVHCNFPEIQYFVFLMSLPNAEDQLPKHGIASSTNIYKHMQVKSQLSDEN